MNNKIPPAGCDTSITSGSAIGSAINFVRSTASMMGSLTDNGDYTVYRCGNL